MLQQESGELVFVYGTLRRGGSNAFRMDGAEFVADAEVAGKLVAITWYPGLVPGKADQWVKGEVYYVSPDHLRALDEYEGLAAGEVEGSEYCRTRMKAYPIGSQNAWGEAWVWQWLGEVDEKRVVESGDWMDFEHPRPAAWFTCVALGCLVAFFVFLLNVPDPHSRSRPLTPMDRLTAQLVFGSPVVAFLIAWFAGRRREKWQPLRRVVVVVSACLSLLFLTDMFFRALDYLG